MFTSELECNRLDELKQTTEVNTMKKAMKTAHEKKLELAKASSPAYGIYIDGGNLDKLLEAAEIISPLIENVLNSDSEEKTKRMAFELIKSSLPSIQNCSISNVSVNIEKKL